MGKSNGKPGRVDLVVKDAHLCGFRDLVVDIVCTHEFGCSHLADVSLNGQLRDCTGTHGFPQISTANLMSRGSETGWEWWRNARHGAEAR